LVRRIGFGVPLKLRSTSINIGGFTVSYFSINAPEEIRLGRFK